jgi:hypothetical protein
MKALGLVACAALLATPAGADWTDVTEWPLSYAGASVSGTWVDIDNDLDLDIYLVKNELFNWLLRNDGDSGFTIVAAPPLGFEPGTGSAWGDYDNDGDADVYLAGNALLRNDGAGVFTDVTGPAMLALPAVNPWVASWVDIDVDGDLDLFVTANEVNESNRLFLNEGGDVFVDGTTPVLGYATAECTGHAFGDYDSDGDLDLFIAAGLDHANVLLRNDGGLVFTDVTPPVLADVALTSRGIAWIDIDNDADPDLSVTVSNGPNRLFRNDGAGAFTEVAEGTIMGYPGDSWFSLWADFDNDLDLDVYIVTGAAKIMCLNDGAGNFTDVTAPPIDDPAPSIGADAADYDEDGDLDIYAANWQGTNKLFRNDLDTGAHWLAIRPIGIPPANGQPGSNRSGIGARVTVVAGGVTQTRVLGGTPGDRGGMAAAAPALWFGLGANESIDLIEIEWPSGIVDQLQNPAFLDETILWFEGGNPVSAVDTAESPAPANRLHANVPNPFNPRTAITYDLRAAERVRIRIYDSFGRAVRVRQPGLVDRDAGRHGVAWDGRDDGGRGVASGVYYVRIEAGAWTATRPMVLVR